MTEQKKSIFQRAGEWGVPFGLYLACTAITSVFADWFPPLSALFLVLLAGTPFVIYYFQRRKFIEDDGFSEHSALWMLGIMMFILGSVLSSFIVYLVLQYARPNFMYEQAQTVIDIYSKMPDMADNEMLRVLQQAINKRLLPSPIETVFNAFWFVTFGGSVLSAITAVLARRQLHRKNNN